MADLSRRIADLSPEQRALLERRLRQSAIPVGEPIAIIGMGCRFPGAANSPDAFWRLLAEGRDAVVPVPVDRWDGEAVGDAAAALRCGGFLDCVDQFDPGFFGIAPREATEMDPQQRLLLEVAWEALEDAGQPAERLKGSATGVFVGIHSHSSDYYWLQVRDHSTIGTYTASGTAHSIVANRLSYLLDLRGPSVSVDTACSSSLVAVHLACQGLRTGDCDMALAAGVNLMLAPEAGLSFAKLQFLAPDGRCKTFDASANGFGRGEGCGLVVLKRLKDAIRDRDPILALIRGTAVNQDGSTNGLTAPNGLAQEAVVRRALAVGGVEPGAMGYVETHGTGTALGDPIEVEALTAVLGARPVGQPCVLGAVKANIGHLEAAAGIAGLIKAVLCLQHEAIPAQPHFRSLNPHISLAGAAFTIPTSLTPWQRADRARIAGVSSFGFGGTNAHAVLEEAPAASQGAGDSVVTARSVAGAPLLLPISARSGGALRDLANAYRERLGSGEYDAPEAFRNLCYSAAVRRSHHDHRLAVAGRDARDCAARLQSFVADETSPHVAHGRVESERHSGPVFVFSGQGPQWPGMGRELLEAEPVFRGVVERCDALVQAVAGWSLFQELEAPEAASRLAETEIAQPVLFALHVALAAMWRAWGIEPAAVVGHSLGEVAAAHVAGALSLEEAVRVVVHRGHIMQRATGRGRMVAVELSLEDAERAIAGFEERLAVAAVNAPTSTVLSGDSVVLEAVLERLKARGVRCQPLPVNYAFHSPQTEPLAAELVRVLGSVAAQPASVPMISTVTGRALDAGEGDAAYWGRNVRQPVLFAAAVAECLARGHDGYLEIGPHPVLSGAVAACLAAHGRTGVVATSLRRKQPERMAMLSALGTLYAQGFPVDWRKQHPAGGRCVQLPSYPWQLRRYWIEVRRRSPKASATEASVDLMYEVTWRRKPITAAERPGGASCPDLDLAAIVDRAAQALPRELDEEAVELERELLPELDQLSLEYVSECFRRLGVDFKPGAFLGLDVLRKRGVLPRHEGLLRRMLQILEEAGVLSARKDGWVIGRRPQVVDPQERWQRLNAQFPKCDAELSLLNRCGSNLAEVLRGDREPLECIFPDVSLGEAEKFYGNSPFSCRGNTCVREVALATAASLAPGRRLAVLEIGAGTGGTSAHVVPALAPYLARYVYTDVSSRFLQHGKMRLQAFSQVEYRLLDIEREPRQQGYESHGYDLILAANVLHATADLSGTLKHVRSLLAPGGILVLLEGTRTERWIDLIFGLTPGWWKFEDRTRRPRHPLLSAEAWRQVLTEEGFVGSRAVPQKDGSVRGLLQLQVLVAQEPTEASSASHPDGVTVSSRRGRWTILPAQDPVAQALATHLENQGQKADLMEFGTEGTPAVIEAHRIHPDRTDGWDALLRTLRTFGDIHPQGVVLLASSRAHGPTATVQECRIALHLVQAIIRAELPHPPRIWLVTRGAASPESGSDEALLGQATLWGFGRVLAREYPELWGGLVDLDVSATPSEAAAQLAAELTGLDGEDQVAYRSGERRVPRVVRAPVRTMEGRRGILRGDASYLITGGLGGLGLTVARWMVQRGARSLVLVGRSGAAQTQRDAIEALERNGVQVRVARADVSCREDLATVFRDILSSLPPLRGVIHAAGTVDDGVLLSQDWGRFERVFAAKVVGTWNLHEVTLQLPLDFFVVFSSAAALLGPPGQANHAAANAFQDAFVRWRRARGLPALCLNWGPWGSVGAAVAMGSAGRQLWEAQGIGFLSPEEGVEILDLALGQGAQQVIGVRVAWPMFLAQLPEGRLPLFSELSGSTSSAAPSPFRQSPGGAALAQLCALPSSDRSEFLVNQVRACVASVLGHAATDAVELSHPLMDLGLDSLMAVELKKRLEHDWSLDGKLPATLIFKYPTAQHIAGFLGELLEGALQPRGRAATVTPARNEGPKVGAGKLDSASEEEVKRLLAEELASLPADFTDGGSA